MIANFLLGGAPSIEDAARFSLLVLVAIAAAIYICSKKAGYPIPVEYIRAALAGYAIVQILFIVFLWFNHIRFPLNLEAMELLRVQHLQRLMNGLPLYPEPSSEFVALAYNPLSYLLTAPFAIVLGANLFTMRLVAILGMAGAGIVIFLTARHQTRSSWWGIIATGLFAAAYRVMDTYLDNAHAESWLLCSILLGCYFIDRAKTWVNESLAMLLFVAAFWFKQQGAVFAIAALIFLTWRRGWRAWVSWLIAGGLGAGLYIAMPDWVLGSRFHYFTWQVPRQWVEIQYWEVVRFFKLIGFAYPILAGISAIVFLAQVQRLRHNIWYFMFPIAVLSGVLATLTPGSNSNVYIPMGTWFIVVGIISLDRLIQTLPQFKQSGLHFLALGLSFALFAYNPLSVIVSPQSQTTYQDFVSYLKTLPGTTYAPWIGQLQDQDLFSPTLHWVPLDDLVRGTNPDPMKHPPLEKLLQPVVQPRGKAYLLHNLPLEQDGRLNFLQKNYVLEADLGTRFQALKTLPKHYTLGYPRYLYRHVSN